MDIERAKVVIFSYYEKELLCGLLYDNKIYHIYNNKLNIYRGKFFYVLDEIGSKEKKIKEDIIIAYQKKVRDEEEVANRKNILIKNKLNYKDVKPGNFYINKSGNIVFYIGYGTYSSRDTKYKQITEPRYLYIKLGYHIAFYDLLKNDLIITNDKAYKQFFFYTCNDCIFKYKSMIFNAGFQFITLKNQMILIKEQKITNIPAKESFTWSSINIIDGYRNRYSKVIPYINFKLY